MSEAGKTGHMGAELDMPQIEGEGEGQNPVEPSERDRKQQMYDEKLTALNNHDNLFLRPVIISTKIDLFYRNNTRSKYKVASRQHTLRAVGDEKLCDVLIPKLWEFIQSVMERLEMYPVIKDYEIAIELSGRWFKDVTDPSYAEEDVGMLNTWHNRRITGVVYVPELPVEPVECIKPEDATGKDMLFKEFISSDSILNMEKLKNLNNNSKIIKYKFKCIDVDELILYQGADFVITVSFQIYRLGTPKV